MAQKLCTTQLGSVQLSSNGVAQKFYITKKVARKKLVTQNMAGKGHTNVWYYKTENLKALNLCVK